MNPFSSPVRPEIWEQSGEKVDAFLHFAGTAGSFAGITRFLRTKNPALRAYLVEPAGAAALAGQNVTKPNHSIQGGGYSKTHLVHLDRSLVTDFLQVTDEAAIAAARALAAKEGILAGFSSGAHVSAALDLLASRESGATIAFLICDSGMKYLSTNLFQTHA